MPSTLHQLQISYQYSEAAWKNRMKNPVNRLATAAPRALDSLLGTPASTSQDSSDKKQQQQRRERTCSFDLDLSGLNMDRCSGSVGGASSVGLCGSSIAEEGSVVTFEDLSELAHELSLEWNGADVGTSENVGAASPN